MPTITTPWNGGSFWAPDQEDYVAMMREMWSQQEREQARGLKPLRFAGNTAATISTTVGWSLPYSPEPGYVWSIRMIAAALSTSVSLRAGYGDNGSTMVPNVALINSANTTYPVVTLSGGQAFMNYGEYLSFFASGATTVNSFYLGVIESPSERSRNLII